MMEKEFEDAEIFNCQLERCWDPRDDDMTLDLKVTVGISSRRKSPKFWSNSNLFVNH